jgi:hypothetical protein
MREYYGLDLKTPCIESLVPSEAVVKGGTFGRWVDYEGSDLIKDS